MSSTCSEDYQTASEGLDRATPSQWKAVLQRNGIEKAASPDITNPFMVSQLRANLEHHKKTYPQPDENAWPSCSGPTNPFTSIQLRMIHGSHVYNTRSKKRKLGTKHPALQGPVLEPCGSSNRNRSIYHGDPRKRGGTVQPLGLRSAAGGKPTKLGRYLNHNKPRKQVRIISQSKPNKGNRTQVLERGESSKQGSRAGAQLRTRGSPLVGPPVCRQSITRATLKVEGCLNISTQKIGLLEEHVLHTASEVALTQSQHDFGIRLRIAKLPSEEAWEALSWPLELDFFFDPNSDAVLVVNNTILATRELLLIKQLSTAPKKRPTKIGAFEKAALESSSSYSFFVSDRHMFDITVLPRRYVASTSAPLRLLTQGGKRTVDMLSQQAVPSAAKRMKTRAMHGQSKGKEKGKEPMAWWEETEKETSHLAKNKGKGKGKATDEPSNSKETTSGQDTPDRQETTDASKASTAIQTRSSTELVFASASPFPSGSDLRAGYISTAKHPLSDLPHNASIKIANATREEDYTLIRRDMIANQPYTVVFKAHHSKFSGQLVAVKIWHSVFDLDFVPNAGVRVISQVSEHFIREVRNHTKVNEHSTSMRVTWPNFAIVERIPTALVHNDIKPSNILYTQDRGPVLIDFGWSSDPETVHVAGTPWYIPPEYPREGSRGPAGDIFAFGVVMLFLMRKIPLPELLSPPLKWQIGHLRSKGPEALAAMETMTRWVRIVEKVVDELRNVCDESGGGIIEDVVSRIAEPRGERRLTGPEMIWMLELTIEGSG
ncbi:kinase-like protein [Trichoderma citrinoviride]|uniref:Kinase-like protein n=1 Tax=Trichoderma citrinoviride TaxID=58853 RepID=A0A2T4BNK4_9HYPO|nr:kinase-like protein [Trichoderma citrinoviride]PTB70839.1 kinase-like protein [Trichoderma citrinoviride]